jgi:chemotaxis protein CheY-P-specific phosphatase CheC
MPDALGGAEKIVVAGMLRLTGDFSGYLLVVLDCDQADRITSMVLGKPKRRTKSVSLRRFSAMERSVLSETVNIMGGSYLTAIAEFTGLRVTPIHPVSCADMVGAVISVAVAETGKAGDFAVMFHVRAVQRKRTDHRKSLPGSGRSVVQHTVKVVGVSMTKHSVDICGDENRPFPRPAYIAWDLVPASALPSTTLPAGLGGLINVLLPSMREFESAGHTRTKFADTGISDLVDGLIRAGAVKGPSQGKNSGRSRHVCRQERRPERRHGNRKTQCAKL